MADTCYYGLMRTLAWIPGLNMIPGISNYQPQALERKFHDVVIKKGKQQVDKWDEKIAKRNDQNQERSSYIKHLMSIHGVENWRKSPARILIQTEIENFNRTEAEVNTILEHRKRKLDELNIHKTNRVALGMMQMWTDEERIQKQIGRGISKRLKAYRDKIAEEEEKTMKQTEKELSDLPESIANTQEEQQTKEMYAKMKQKLLDAKQAALEGGSVSSIEQLLLDELSAEGGGGEGGGGEGGGMVKFTLPEPSAPMVPEPMYS